MSNYTLQSTGHSVALTDKDYVADGGEGTIYTQGGIAYKVCHPGKMMPEGKIAELAPLAKHTNIIVPQDILLDAKHHKVGYTMKFIPQNKCWPLAQTFTNSFKQREGLDTQSILDLIKFMRESVDFIHKNNVLIVDMNEFNFLVDKKFEKMFFIDTNSYQTKSYPATAIMDSIKDRHTKGFSTLSDWFSFGIISFEMLIGIHPFRGGSHPKFASGNVDERMDARMRANVSVLNARTKYPKGATQSLAIIPKGYLDWYKAIFEQGKRLAPPTDFAGPVLVVVTTPVLSSDSLDLKLYQDLTEDITGYKYVNGLELITTGVKQKKIKAGGNTYSLPRKMEVVYHHQKLIGVSNDGQSIFFYDIFNQKELSFPAFSMNASQIMSYDNRVYAQVGERIVEIVFNQIGAALIPSPLVVAHTSENSTKMFPGLIVQNWFSSNIISIFPNKTGCYQHKIKEFDKHTILDAEFNSGLAIFVLKQYNKFVRCSIKFADDYSSYKISSWIEIPGPMDINFTVLDSGIAVWLNEDDDLELFSKSPHSLTAKKVSDKVLSSGIKLFSRGAKVLIAKGSKLYEATLKK
jgi:hypothetical protein